MVLALEKELVPGGEEDREEGMGEWSYMETPFGGTLPVMRRSQAWAHSSTTSWAYLGYTVSAVHSSVEHEHAPYALFLHSPVKAN